MLASAHDLSEGGLAVALAESCLRAASAAASALLTSSGRRPRAIRPDALDPAAALFSESAGRALVSVAPGREDEFAALCAAHGVPATVLGDTGGDALVVDGTFEVPLAELARVWAATLPALFG